MDSEFGERAVRIVVGLGNAERERRLVPELTDTGHIAVVARCLAADQVPDALQRTRADVAVLALDLHRLNDTALAGLAATGLPLVGLATRRGEAASDGPWAAVLPVDADPQQLRSTIAAVLRGERPQPAGAGEDEDAGPVTPAAVSSPTASSLIVVASGKGSPGCSTLAVNLAAAIGAVEPTVAVDLDLAGPSLAALLGLNPRLNVYMLAHAEPKSSREWSKALDQELQPLAARSPHAAVLAGIPKPEMRSAITLSFLQRLLPELQQRFCHVVLDIGTIQGPWGEWAWQGWLAGGAGQVLFVSAASLAGVNQARMALARLPGLRCEQVALVVGRYDRRTQHSRAEIEFNVGRPVAAFIPYDHAAMEQAAWAQQPVVFSRRSRAGRMLLEFAERVHGGRILLPPETASRGRRRLPRPHVPAHLPRPRFGWPPLRASAPVAAAAPVPITEVGDVDGAAAI